MEKKSDHSAYHQKWLPEFAQKQLNVGLIAPMAQGKTELVFECIQRMIDIKTNRDCHIFFFSTTLGSDVNKSRFEELQRQLKCASYIFEEIPDKDVNEMRAWLTSFVNRGNSIDAVMKALGTSKAIPVEQVELFYTTPNQPRFIIVLDDIYVDLIKVQKLLTLVRHLNCNFIISTHSWVNLSPSIKQYIDIFFCRQLAPRHIADIYTQFVQATMDQETFKKIVQMINEKPYHFFFFATHLQFMGVFELHAGFKEFAKIKK